MRCFIREKKIECGPEILAAEIFQYSENRSMAVKGKRSKKQKESAPQQKDLNNKRAKRYFIYLSNKNFGIGDMVVHLTYANEFLPPTPEEAHKIVINYIRRVDYWQKKLMLPPLKYLLVTQIGRKKDGTNRIHHHILLTGGLDRDFVENLWYKNKGSKKKKIPSVMYGWSNADRLRPNNKGIAQLAGYMIQDSVGKKHWTQSQNLDKPESRNNDYKYSLRQIQKICSISPDSDEYRKYWEKKYPGYEYIESEREFSDTTGWAVYLILRRMNC